ncbi:sporulation protein [Bacillus sp. 3255]|uniref:sporulation protein n=1 Tax=Bacillus sp. 3255 TaxID=2817904 RepID=UPI002862C2F7|nr:sporulation protein [Bacillus sp. 3255]MDR6882110.1 sporulation-control protein [Bacillus sp. 3255]
MSFFKKMLASAGIGNIEVDAQFHTNRFVPGELVDGIVLMKGGSVEQKVEKIYFQIMTEYLKPSQSDSDRKEKVTAAVANILLGERLTIAAGESVEIPFHFELPHETPISIGAGRIWIHTGLDIDNAVDPSDRDYIQVAPHPHTAILFEALEEIGFHLHKAENEYYPQRNYHLPFIQNFEFVPYQNGEYRSSVDELELVFYPNENGVEVIMELDRRGRGFGGMLADLMDTDESLHRYYFSIDELEAGAGAVADQLRGILDDLLG